MYQEQAIAELVRIRGHRRTAAVRHLAEYRSAFLRWDERSSVRRKPRRMLGEPDDDAIYFPPELFPAANHQLVRERGAEFTRRLLVGNLYNYLYFTTELEELAVIPVAGRISRGRIGLDLPAQMQADAFKIVTDEAWHAQFSADFAQQVEAHTGVPRNRCGIPAFASRLDVVRNHLPPEARGLESLLFAIVSETLTSGILADIPHDTRLPQAVRDLVRDHGEDEGRHHVYFRTVLRHLWPALSTAQRQAVGPMLPEIVFAFLEPDYFQIGAGLRACGLDASATERVLLESWPVDRVLRDTAEAAAAVVQNFRMVGALDDAGTAAAFAEAGLLASTGPSE